MIEWFNSLNDEQQVSIIMICVIALIGIHLLLGWVGHKTRYKYNQTIRDNTGKDIPWDSDEWASRTAFFYLFIPYLTSSLVFNF